jgi:hypothetical protein
MLPVQVAPGDYSVWRESIELHLAVTLSRAEFYPPYTHIRIGGSQTGILDQTYFFPSVYNNNPGMNDLNVYSPRSA